MIYTVTFNPSIDYNAYVSEFKEGAINRCADDYMSIGGKGINVSVILTNLGIENTALGFIAGATGEIISKELALSGINTKFITLKNGFSRINLKLKSNLETDVNGTGPKAEKDDLRKLYDFIGELDSEDFLILSGSVCRGVDEFAYSDIMKTLKGKNINVVVDATDKLLLNTLKYEPFLIKPNNFELAHMFETQINTEEDIIKYSNELIKMGAQNVLVSLGADGAILVCRDGTILKNSAPKGRVINTTGAGDSMVAGFVAGYIHSKDLEYALKLSICAGSATAFSNKLANNEEIMRLLTK